MPIRKYLAGASFDPDAIAVMVIAFERACTILNLHDPADPMIEVVAKKVIALASQGMTDATEIQRRVVADTDQAQRAAE